MERLNLWKYIFSSFEEWGKKQIDIEYPPIMNKQTLDNIAQWCYLAAAKIPNKQSDQVDEEWFPYYTYRNDSWWKFKNPTTERIHKVFPSEYREFDNVIGLRTDYNIWFFHEDDLREYIDKWLFWEKAWEHYHKEVDNYKF